MSLGFLPWLRGGAAGQLATGPEGANRLKSSITLKINETQIAPMDLRLLGPGDVLGFDQRLVVRTDPGALAGRVEPTIFPAVEFDEPTLPWLFTPAGADGAGRLRTWIRLVVVRKQDGVGVSTHPDTKAETLTIAPPAVPAAELPDPAESWAWAHVQVSGPVGDGDVHGVLAREPARSVSRLLCPRRLSPATAYVACVVPAFAAGVAAGLGQTVDDDGDLTDAWAAGAGRVELPVYYRWEFATGEAGDFESLARAIQGRPAATGVGRRALDLRAPGFAPPADAAPAQAEGALRAAGDPPASVEWFAAHLAGQLAAPDPRAVRPPLYGGIQKGVGTLPAAGWMRDLNVEPRHRAAAGLGVRIVREQQERLMEAAWAQAGELEAANRFLARQDMALSVGDAIMGRRLAPLAGEDPDALLRLTAPARLAMGGPRARARAAGLPDTALDPAFRRLSRPRGPLARRLARDGDAGLMPERPLGVAASGVEPEILGELQPGDNLMRRATHQLAAPSELAVLSRPEPWSSIVRAPSFPAPMAVELQNLSSDFLLPGAERLERDTAVLLKPNYAFVAAFMAGLNHEMSRELLWREYPSELSATPFRVFWDRRGQVAPEATLEELADIAPIADWGSSNALGVDVRRAPEGELVLVVRGELLRRYPRAVVSAVKAAAGAPRRVLTDPTIAGNSKPPLFTGFLEPDIAFFGFALSEEKARGDDDGLGWFIVFQEQPFEPRFGLDAFKESQFTDPPLQAAPDGQSRPALPSAELAWGHLVAKAPFEALAHAPVLAARPAGWWFSDRPDLSFTGGAADLAALTLQRPARVALHAELLLPAKGTT